MPAAASRMDSLGKRGPDPVQVRRYHPLVLIDIPHIDRTPALPSSLPPPPDSHPSTALLPSPQRPSWPPAWCSRPSWQRRWQRPPPPHSSYAPLSDACSGGPIRVPARATYIDVCRNALKVLSGCTLPFLLKVSAFGAPDGGLPPRVDPRAPLCGFRDACNGRLIRLPAGRQPHCQLPPRVGRAGGRSACGRSSAAFQRLVGGAAPRGRCHSVVPDGGW